MTNLSRCLFYRNRGGDPAASHLLRSAAQLATVVAAGVLLAGCATDVGRPSDQELAQHGYWFHDANHQYGSSGQTSPQAIYNATHGVWLWPPAEVDIPN